MGLFGAATNRKVCNRCSYTTNVRKRDQRLDVTYYTFVKSPAKQDNAGVVLKKNVRDKKYLQSTTINLNIGSYVQSIVYFCSFLLLNCKNINSVK